MTRSILSCIFVLAACGDNLTPEASQDAGPDYDAAPDVDAAPLPPEADGEYATRISPIAFICSDGPHHANTLRTLTDLVTQEDPWKFDLLNDDFRNSFEYYGRQNAAWDEAGDGYFVDKRVNLVSFGYFTVQARRLLNGSANPDGTFNAFHRYDLGMKLKDGTWMSFCVYEGDIDSTRRYTRWEGTPRTSIDGQWRVKKTVIESPLYMPQMLPYTHFVTMDTISQADDDSVFDIRGIYHDSLGWYALRNPTTGSVNALGVEVFPNGIETTVYETKLWGTILPDSMDLEFSWKWYVAETGQVKWFQHERYQGVPRYNPHDTETAEPPQGAYNAEYALLDSDCGLTPYTQHDVLDVWLMDNGAVWPKITGLDVEPVVQLGFNGEVAMAFSLYGADSTIYTYTIDDDIDNDGEADSINTIDGHAVNLNMRMDAINWNGLHVCTAKYKITGQKRYESYWQPTVQ